MSFNYSHSSGAAGAREQIYSRSQLNQRMKVHSDELYDKNQSLGDDLSEDEQRQATKHQARQIRKFQADCNRTLVNQRERIAKIRMENESLRQKIADAENLQRKTEDETKKTNEAVSTLMNVKFEVEEDLEGCLLQFDNLKKTSRKVAAKINEYQLKDKTIIEDRELEREAQKQEKQIHYVETKCGETIAYNKHLRAAINEFRLDKLNARKKIADKEKKIHHFQSFIVQLVNIINSYYQERVSIRLLSSNLIAENSREAEEFRKTMVELSNRIEYHEKVMQDREEEFRRSLQEGERQSNAANEAAEEAKEVERSRQQTLIETFDRLMHVFGTWEVEELVDKFLLKEEQNIIQSRYLEALNNDALVIEGKVKALRQQIHTFEGDKDDDREGIIPKLQTEIDHANKRSETYEQKTKHCVSVIEDVVIILQRLRNRMSKTRLLARDRPSKRRWAFLRANLKLAIVIVQRSDLMPIAPAPNANSPADDKSAYDPRTKLLSADLDWEEFGAGPTEALIELSRTEESTLKLLDQYRLQKSRTKFPPKPVLRARWLAAATKVQLPTTSGPKYVMRAKGDRATVLLFPSVKDMDSPRTEFPLSPKKIKADVNINGFSLKVSEKLRKAIAQRNANTTPPESAGNQKGTNSALPVQPIARVIQKMSKIRRFGTMAQNIGKSESRSGTSQGRTMAQNIGKSESRSGTSGGPQMRKRMSRQVSRLPAARAAAEDDGSEASPSPRSPASGDRQPTAGLRALLINKASPSLSVGNLPRLNVDS